MAYKMIIFTILFSVSFASATNHLKYCVPVEKIDFNPYRKIEDGKELAYLTLLRSYISTVPNETGILQSYEFSPDGSIFTAKINQIKWDDGSSLTAIEAAEGISKTLP